MSVPYKVLKDVDTLGVMSAWLAGTKTYYQVDTGEFVEVPLNLLELVYVVEHYELYYYEATPWWETYRGLVMVRDYDEHPWIPDTLYAYSVNRDNDNYECQSGRYKQARLLTQVEYEAIKFTKTDKQPS